MTPKDSTFPPRYGSIPVMTNEPVQTDTLDTLPTDARLREVQSRLHLEPWPSSGLNHANSRGYDLFAGPSYLGEVRYRKPEGWSATAPGRVPLPDVCSMAEAIELLVDNYLHASTGGRS